MDDGQLYFEEIPTDPPTNRYFSDLIVDIYNVKINLRNLVLVLEDLLREETEPPVREAGEELGDVDPPCL